MKKRYFLYGLLIILIPIYYAFEPLIPNPLAWSTLPEGIIETKGKRINDSLWFKPIETAGDSLELWKQKLNAPSLSEAIGFKGQVLWNEAIGYADIDDTKLADQHTIYRVGSISKSITSTALATLLQSGTIDLDDKIGPLLTDYKIANGDITLRQLASHSGGIRHYNFCWCIPVHEGFSNESYKTVKDAVAVFGEDKPLYEPGTKFSYSTYGYTLLSAAMEGVSNKSFPDLLQDNVLNPLNMDHTLLGGWNDTSLDIAQFYTVKDNRYKKGFDVDISNKWAGGGMLSTPTDLIKMGMALLNNQLIDEEVKVQLFTPQTLSSGEVNPQNYGIGWRIDTTERLHPDQQVKIIHHGGTIEGSIALLILFPEYGLVASLIANRSGSSGELFLPMYSMVRPFVDNVKLLHPVQ